MTSPNREFLRSPFENVFQILPQGHDKALKQAFYNTAATLFVVLASCAAVAVYYILEPFLRPLLWAVLCGTFLFPFKCTLTDVSRRWLRGLRESGTPLVVGLVLVPVRTVDGAAERLGSFWWSHLKAIVVGTVIIPTLYLVFFIWPVQSSIFDLLASSFFFVYEAHVQFSALWVWSLVLCYVIVLVVFWSPSRTTALKLLSLPVWLALLCHLASSVGLLRIPLVFLGLALVASGFVSEMNDLKNHLKNMFQQQRTDETTDLPTGEDVPAADADVDKTPQRSTGPAADFQTPLNTKSNEESAVESDVKSCEQESETIVQNPPSSLKRNHPPPSNLRPRGKPPKRSDRRSISDYFFIVLLWSLFLVHLWIYKFVFLLLPLLLLCYCVKRLGEYIGLWKATQEYTKRQIVVLREKFVHDPRLEILVPKPLRRFGRLLLQGDAKIIDTLDSTMDKMTSVLIIFFLIVGVVLVTFFAGMEIHRESMHLVRVSSNILNKTHHPELAQWLPEQDVVNEALDSMVNNAYVYGREWIISKLRGILNGDDGSREQVEKQVLKLWDNMYVNWFTKNRTLMSPSDVRSLQSQLNLNLSDVASVSDVVTRFQSLNLDVVGFARENVGTFVNLMKSVWTVLVSNIALTVKVITSMLSVIFGGGTAILNVVLSAVIFLTTLFYLLSSSGNQYKPAELFSSLSPAQGSGDDITFGKAFEDAIGSVFLASIKMAAFYGLYTWLTHTIFGIQIVFIPSALAAMFAAVPFLGTYCAALPAVVELWLVNGQKIEAILLFVAHYLPTLFVDTAFYSEIKGGHPYLTGLAIAGGMYWMGLEGAIVGPVVLCCLIVAVNMYQTMLKPDTSAPEKPRVISGATDKRVKFNLTRSAISEDFQ